MSAGVVLRALGFSCSWQPRQKSPETPSPGIPPVTLGEKSTQGSSWRYRCRGFSDTREDCGPKNQNQLEDPG